MDQRAPRVRHRLADWLADRKGIRSWLPHRAAPRRAAAKLHLLTTKQVQDTSEGDHSDDVGFLLGVRGETCSWVLRCTSPTGGRREMGLGFCRRESPAQAGDSLTSARDGAHKGRELLRQGLDPIDQRDQQRATWRQAEDVKKAEKARERWTLARCARDYHERFIEPKRSKRPAKSS